MGQIDRQSGMYRAKFHCKTTKKRISKYFTTWEEAKAFLDKNNEPLFYVFKIKAEDFEEFVKGMVLVNKHINKLKKGG